MFKHSHFIKGGERRCLGFIKGFVDCSCRGHFLAERTNTAGSRPHYPIRMLGFHRLSEQRA